MHLPVFVVCLQPGLSRRYLPDQGQHTLLLFFSERKDDPHEKTFTDPGHRPNAMLSPVSIPNVTTDRYPMNEHINDR